MAATAVAEAAVVVAIVAVAVVAVAVVAPAVVAAKGLASDMRHERDSNQTGSTHTNNPEADVVEKS